jgi:tripartite-type tricarboxylate transporter receptor subunit TctC
MWRRRCLLLCVSVIALLLGGIVAARAQEIGPPRPFEIIVPWGPGGSADKLARKMAVLMQPSLGPLRVTNIAGASGQKGLAQLKAAPADGRTLAILTGDTFGALAARQTDVRPDNFVAVAILMRQPSALLVSENGKFKTWNDVVAAAKTAAVRVAIAGPRSADELTVNYFVRQGLRLVSVPHTKPGERHRALLGGYADVLYEQVGDVRTFVGNAQMRPVLLLAPQRDARLKDVPAAGEMGFDVALPHFRALIVRAGTDTGAIAKLREAVAAATKGLDYTQFLEEQYADADVILSPEAANAFLREALARLRTLAAAQDAMVGR